MDGSMSQGGDDYGLSFSSDCRLGRLLQKTPRILATCEGTNPEVLIVDQTALDVSKLSHEVTSNWRAMICCARPYGTPTRRRRQG